MAFEPFDIFCGNPTLGRNNWKNSRRIFKIRSVAVLGHSNGVTHIGSPLVNALWSLHDAAPGDGRTPVMRCAADEYISK